MMTCAICRHPLKQNHKRYCSRPCVFKGLSQLYRQRAIQPPSQKGIPWSSELRAKMQPIRYAQTPSMTRPEVVAKAQATKKKTYDIRGRKTEGRMRFKTLLVYRMWRKSVFERDDYRCFDCGERGGYLEAHHIYPYATFPRLRLMLENGITLCRSCHKKTKTYGRSIEKQAAIGYSH